MTRSLLLLSLCLLRGAASGAQTTALPYAAGFDDAASSWQVFRKGSADPFYKWTPGSMNGYAGNCLYHGYPVGGTAATDDWFVSPAFSFASGGRIDSLRHFFSGMGTPQPGDTVAIYLLQGSADPALATRTLLHDFRGANYAADAAWNKTGNILIAPVAGNSYLAFRYRTVAN